MATRGKNFELLIEHFKVACEPHYYEREDSVIEKIEKVYTDSENIDNDKALLHLVTLFIK